MPNVTALAVLRAPGSLRLVSSQGLRHVTMKHRVDRNQTQIFRLCLANEKAIKRVAMEVRQLLQKPQVNWLNSKQYCSSFLHEGEQTIDAVARYTQLADGDLDGSLPQ